MKTHFETYRSAITRFRNNPIPAPGKTVAKPPPPPEIESGAVDSLFLMDLEPPKEYPNPFALPGPSVSQTGALGCSIWEAYESCHKSINEAPINYIGGFNGKATVAVIDIFSANSEGHGRDVTQILARSGGLGAGDITMVEQERPTLETTALLWPGPESPEERVDAYIELQALHLLEGTSQVLEEMLDRPGITTINQSLGMTDFKIAIGLLELASQRMREGCHNADYLLEAFGVEEGPMEEKARRLSQAIIDRVESVNSNSARLKVSRRRHEGLSKKLADRGVSYVLPAGNGGAEIAWAREFGVNVPEGAEHSYLTNGQTIVVGAIDNRGTLCEFDDRVTDWSVEDPHLSFLASGENVPVITEGLLDFKSGTSYAAPLVAGRLERARRLCPEKSPQELGFLIADHPGVPGSDVPVVS